MNNLDNLLTTLKEEHIDTSSMDFKTKRLINATSRHHTIPKFTTITAMALLAFVTVLGSYNAYQNHQHQVALENLRQERASFNDSEYIYTTLLSSYGNTSGE